MNYFPWLLLLVFLQSISSSILQRGAYFFTEYQLHYTARQNLLLAIGYGLAYIAGAISSHRTVKRLGERRALSGLIAIQGLLACSLPFCGSIGSLGALWMATAIVNGMSWPVAESYASAGRDAASTCRAVGFYNLAWSCSVPIAVWISGPLIDHAGSGLFYVAGGLSLAAAMLVRMILPVQPPHHHDGHPDRPDEATIAGYQPLLTSSRWSMVASYMLICILGPLMPKAFNELGYTATSATLLAGAMDAARAITFLVLMRWPFWHGRRDLLFWAAILLPASFVLILTSSSMAPILIGEIVFGVALGVAYYAALYYAMVAHNASVDAGGEHESLIGAGFTAGPLAALGGTWLGPLCKTTLMGGTLVGVAPLAMGLLAAGIWPLRQAGKVIKPSAEK